MVSSNKFVSFCFYFNLNDFSVPATTPSTASSSNNVDPTKKQEELFSSMEHQYEVARQVTHSMRGVGLGFGSQPRF